jgi:acyl carrier protein
MEIKRSDALEVVVRAVRELQGSGVISDAPKSLTADTVLFGQGGFVDSLGLVQVAAETERLIDEAFNVSVAIADERAMSRSQSPFRTIGSLADYVVELVREQ